MAFPSLRSGIFSAATGGVADTGVDISRKYQGGDPEPKSGGLYDERLYADQAFRDSSPYMPTAVDQDSSALRSQSPSVDNRDVQPPSGSILPTSLPPPNPSPFLPSYVDNTPLSWTQPGAIQP